MLRRSLSSSFWQLLKCDSTHFDCLRRGLAWLCTCISSLVHQTRLANWNKCGLHAYDTCINRDAEYNWFVCTQIYVYICLSALLICYMATLIWHAVIFPLSRCGPFCFGICTCAAGNPKMFCMRSRLIFVLIFSSLCCFSFTSISSLHGRKTPKTDALTRLCYELCSSLLHVYILSIFATKDQINI